MSRYNGEARVMNNGDYCVIKEYRNVNDIDVEFEDGTKVCNVSYHAFTAGKIIKP